MCFSQPSAAAAPAQQIPSPAPPPPQQAPKPPDIDAGPRNQRENASTQRQGSAIFRNDLTIPTASSTGNGLNIPTV